MIMQPLRWAAGVAEYRIQADELYAAYTAGDISAKDFVHTHHPRLSRWQGMGEYPFTEVGYADIQLALTEWYYFETWQHLEEWAEEASSPGSRVSSFEAAAEAILSGNLSRLDALLRLYPSLIGHRSLRRHHATLLHYIAANGVEYRDHYPLNAVALLDRLLAAGADVDATAGMYGGGATTLGLVATSIHPAKAGLLIPLLDRLIAAGAALDAADAAGNHQRVVNGCLANGRPEAAVYLAQRGAQLDLEGAAGVGRLDLVEGSFDPDGRLKPGISQTQLQRAFNWACEYGHTPVVSYLMDKGVSAGEPVDGMNGLHMSLLGGHLETIRLLIARGAPLEAPNGYGGTALGMALWTIEHRDPVHTWPEATIDNVAVIEALINAGAEVGPKILAGLQWQQDRLDPSIVAGIEAVLRRHGIEPWKS